MASVWAKLKGIVGNIFTLGISSNAHALKDDTDGVAIRNNADSQNSNIIIARPQGVNQNVHGTTYLDLKERAVDIEFAFDGSTYTPGSHNTQYGMCHTSGGGYTAGVIYLETGVNLDPIPMYKMMLACSRITFTGTVGMIEDGLYLSESAVPPCAWTLKGDGGATGIGIEKMIRVPFTFNDIGSPVYSTASIPAGSKILRSTVVVNTSFTGGSGPTCLVEIDGATVDTILQATADNNLALTSPINYFDNTELIEIPAGQGGRIRVTLGGTASTGTGEVDVTFAQPLS
jgi:hypothetical protein